MTKHMEIKPIACYLPEAETYFKSKGKSPELPISSLQKLNDVIWGLSKQTMTTVGARTSMGKSAFVGQIVADLLDQDKSVLYLSFEMTQRELVARLFSHKSRVPNYEVTKGNFESYINNWADFCEYLNDKKLVVTTGFGATWEEIDAFLSSLKKVPDVVIIDFIQSIKGSSKDGGKSFIDEYIRHFRQMCIEKNFAGVIVSQLNRSNQETKSKTPQMHQLKGTGYLEEHSDCVILLEWLYKTQSSKDKEKYQINVAKNRDGKTGFINVRFIPEIYTFKEYDETAD